MFAVTLPHPPLGHTINLRSPVFAWLRRLRSWLREGWCALLPGHDMLLHTTPERMCLRCASCGHETPGWRIQPYAVMRRKAA
jgi:hypothetical protein